VDYYKGTPLGITNRAEDETGSSYLQINEMYMNAKASIDTVKLAELIKEASDYIIPIEASDNLGNISLCSHVTSEA